MIYILAGTDTKKKNKEEQSLVGNRERIALSLSLVSKQALEEYASSKSLFGESPVVVLENIFAETDFFANAKDLEMLAESETLFIFNEDSFLVSAEKKYQKYAKTIRFDSVKEKNAPKIDPFKVANLFAKRDKIGAWTALVESLEAGTPPESISGTLFWKIKTMILSGARTFSREELVGFSSLLVALYHDAHSGKQDFAIGLEKFVLSTLAK